VNDVDLQPDQVVEELESLAGESPDLLALAGYLGPAHGEGAEGRVRLHADASMNRWVELDRNIIKHRVRLTPPKGVLAPLSVIWVESSELEQQRFDAPPWVEMDFLNDRADLYFEPPRTMLEAVEYMKMPAYHYNWGMTKRSRRPTWHC
jgi:hypothetical protein